MNRKKLLNSIAMKTCHTRERVNEISADFSVYKNLPKNLAASFGFLCAPPLIGKPEVVFGTVFRKSFNHRDYTSKMTRNA